MKLLCYFLLVLFLNVLHIETDAWGGFRCHKGCNGNGVCDIESRCHCNTGYTGLDCSQRKCPYDHAWADKAHSMDIYVDAFKALNQRLAVTNSDYLRTTDQRHLESVQKLWTMCSDAGDIYLSSYEGWYCEREEAFVPDAEAEANDFKDPGSGVPFKPLKRISEASYFFRMSKFTERLIAHIEAKPSFIEPQQYRNNILKRLREDGLKDLSVSRTSFSWGIPMPEGFDQKHVMYVWFDALSNYLTGVNGLCPDQELARYWPANKHIVGKDIIWFHCVIWPCMLMSAGVPLPGSRDK